MKKKNYICVHFKCCNIYNRIYVNKDGTAYTGRCPGCLRPVRVKIGPHGIHARFFDAF